MSASLRTARLDLIRAGIDAAATPGKLLLYEAPRPATFGGATAAALQCEITLEQPCAVVAAAVFTLAVPVEGVRIDNKAITWGRFLDGDDNFVGDANVRITGYVSTGPGDEPDIQIDNPNGYIGGFVRIETPSTIGE